MRAGKWPREAAIGPAQVGCYPQPLYFLGDCAACRAFPGCGELPVYLFFDMSAGGQT
eukprot:GDKH01024992.1.p4 GENE.GDKH01024992.1~~GDKH01024992.1.p4  ORF type:complete len:57 (-),score=0.26 GDKH01024992.1:242-412(-)